MHENQNKLDSKQLKKELRKKIRRFFRWDNLKRILIFIMGAALIATTILPYVL